MAVWPFLLIFALLGGSFFAAARFEKVRTVIGSSGFLVVCFAVLILLAAVPVLALHSMIISAAKPAAVTSPSVH